MNICRVEISLELSARPSDYPEKQRGIHLAVALAWMTIIGELSSSVPLYSGPWATVSVVIFTEGFSNHFGTASALASILIVAAFVPLFLTYRVLGERAALGM